MAYTPQGEGEFLAVGRTKSTNGSVTLYFFTGFHADAIQVLAVGEERVCYAIAWCFICACRSRCIPASDTCVMRHSNPIAWRSGTVSSIFSTIPSCGMSCWASHTDEPHLEASMVGTLQHSWIIRQPHNHRGRGGWLYHWARSTRPSRLSTRGTQGGKMSPPPICARQGASATDGPSVEADLRA